MFTSMTEPSANQDDREAQSAAVSPAKKVAMLSPGFREEVEPSVLRPRILGVKVPANPSDQRNLKFAGIALLVSLTIFGILEYKQLYEAAREAKHSAYGTAREVKHSLFDFFGK